MRLDQLADQYSTLRGAGRTIAVLDTGIDYTHPAFGSGFGTSNPNFTVIGGKDFVDNDDDPMDTDGHGTAVAGVIAANTFETGGFTYRGIVPDAKLVAVRIAATPTASVPLERLEAALQWVIANNDIYHFTAVNLSFGSGFNETNFTEPVIGDELTALAALGIAFIASSGNDGTSNGFGIDYPAAHPTAFSVGSVNPNDVISEFTQRSANLDMLAVGESVRTTGLNGQYVTVVGTSFAAPALTGAIALIRNIEPVFTLGDIRSILRAANPTNFDGDIETGLTTGRTFQRLDLMSTVGIANTRRTGGADQSALIGKAGNENDLIFDSEGVLHFAWYDNDARTAKYAVRSLNGRWSIPSNIDDARPDVGTEFSMKLDSLGRPVIAYLDGPEGDLELAQLRGDGWILQTIEDKGVTGLYPSLAIDAQDRLFISYFRKTTQDLKMASFDGYQWSRETIDNDGNVGWSSTIALDRDQLPAITYGDAGRNRLMLTRLYNNSWTREIVDEHTEGAAYMSLAFDTGNRPSISYYEVQPADLKFASYDGFSWRTVRVATRGATGLYTNLYLDNASRPTILYWDKRVDQLMRATSSNGIDFKTNRVQTTAGKYTMIARSTLTGNWTYATNIGERLILRDL